MLKITDWDKNFETHKTRILKRIDWVPVPNKMDGDGYTELVDHPDGAAHLGVWIALLLIASKSTPRGDLARSGGIAHDTASLARMTRLPSAVLAPGIARLLKIGWLKESGADPAFSGADPALTGRRIEGNGMEWNGREGKGALVPARVVVDALRNPSPLRISGDEFEAAWERHKFYTGNRGLDSDKNLVAQTISGMGVDFDPDKFRDRHPKYCNYHEHTRRPWTEFGVLSMLSWIRAGMTLPPKTKLEQELEDIENAYPEEDSIDSADAA